VSKLYPEIAACSCSEIDAFSSAIEAFLNQEDVEFTLSVAHLDSCTAFQQAVLLAEHGIPRGSVSTYGLIAAHMGNAKAARPVGTALATNPFPIIVPCHRAIQSGRHIGGYQGGTEMKRALLEMEGIPFDDAGWVASAQCHYERIMSNRVKGNF
jgi:methylated-DNA-[protein]-cysteine S-methyltransferase